MDGVTAVALVLLFLDLLPLFALISIVRRESWRFTQLDRNKMVWVLVMVLGLLLPVLGVIAGGWYFLAVRPKLDVAPRPIGFPSA